MQNWKVTPAEVFAASPLVPVMVINDLEQALPMAKALLDGGISGVRDHPAHPGGARGHRPRSPRRCRMPWSVPVPCSTARSFDAAVAAGARFVISPGMTPALLAHAAKSTAPLIPGVATPS